MGEVMQQWVLFSLTIWGLIITTLTALIPAINALIGIWYPGVEILTPDWVQNLDVAVRTFIETAGTIFGLGLIVWDRLFKDTNKALVFNPFRDDTVKKMIG